MELYYPFTIDLRKSRFTPKTTTFIIVKTATLGDPNVMQEPYTRFNIHYLDINRMDVVLKNSGVNYFAMETRVSQTTWVLHIPDVHREQFDDLVQIHNFNLSPMNHIFWVQDRNMDAIHQGIMSKTAKKALIAVVLVLLIVMIGVVVFGFV